MNQDIYSFIKEKESEFETQDITIGSNWDWNMKNHIQMIFHLKNGRFFTGANDFTRVFKNIMQPILNLCYWAEDIEVKDVIFYIESKMGRVLSFLIKKYHDEVYVKENNLDTLFDEITEDDIDYGGVLVQKGKDKPEVIFLPSIAFCDQTDMLGGPVGFKFSFAPDKLRSMASKGWGSKENGATISIEDLIILAQPEKDAGGNRKNKTTGKNIEVYIVKGSLPEAYLKDNDNMEDYCNQIQIVGFYTNKKQEQEGVTLYRKKETESSLKFHTSKKVYSRALGMGEGESLLQPLVWTNFLEIHKMNMLEAGSKVPLYTDDGNYTQANKIQDMENLEITTIQDGKRIFQVPTVASANIQLFEREINDLYEHAQSLGSAYDPMLGKEAVSGTTFRGQERTIQQGRGLHDRRRGQRAKFLEEIYRDWIIPDIVKKILKGKEFLATLTTDEIKWVSDALSTNYANRQIIDDILDGKTPTDFETLKSSYLLEFQKKGSKHLIKILKDEFRGVEVKMGISVAKKQKNLADLSDKILSIFQFAFADPIKFQQALQIPALAKSFNSILEFSGLSEVDFSEFANTPLNLQNISQPSQQQLLQQNV